MEKHNLLPAVMVEKAKKRVIATVALSLKSLLKRSLFEKQRDVDDTNGKAKESWSHAGMERFLRRNREEFIKAISTWPADTVLELRLNAMPNIARRTLGTLDIFLLLRTAAGSEAEAKARVISRFLALTPLVFTFMPEAEFGVVDDEAVIRQALSPFPQSEAVAITRRVADIPLCESRREMKSTGFGKAEEKDVLVNSLSHLFPWIPSLDDWSMVCSALVQQIDPYAVIVRLRPSASSEAQRRKLAENIQACEWFLTTGINNMVALDKQTSLLREALVKQAAALENPCLDLGVFVTGTRPVDDSIINVLAAAITAPCHGGDGERPFLGGNDSRVVSVSDTMNIDFSPEEAPFSATEAAAAFRLPSPPESDWTGLPVIRFRTAAAIISGNAAAPGAIALCENVHQGVKQPIAMGADDRMRHVFIIGQTGTGKSTLMENMIVQDFENGQGVAVIDPHGDLVASLIGRVPESRIEDVILFDVLDREYPIGMNILKWDTPEERDLLIDELYLTIDRLYDMATTGGPIFESYFRSMLKLLMGNTHREEFAPTILEFPLCFIDEDFRSWLKQNFQNKDDLDFIIEMERVSNDDGKLRNVSPYITSKFTRFVKDDTIRRIVGQETCLDFDDIMNNRKILLVSLGKGRFGSIVSAILANHIVTRFKLAAMKRGDLPPEQRKDFFLYVDECHNLPSENFCELLSESRKYRLGLVLATQYAAQLNKPGFSGDRLLSAIFGNVGTKLTFRLGPEDAQLIAPMLAPVFSSLDVIGLSNWQGYVHSNINNEVTPPFSFRSPKTIVPFDKTRAAKIKRLSRITYGRNKDDVDRGIALRRDAWKLETESADENEPGI